MLTAANLQVGDEDRGYQLELLLTKLRYAAAAYEGGDDGEWGAEEDQLDLLAEGLQVGGGGWGTGWVGEDSNSQRAGWAKVVRQRSRGGPAGPTGSQ